MSRIDEFGCRPVTVAVEGYRPIEEGYRMWGSVFLDTAETAPNQRVQIQSRPVISEDDGRCEISVPVIITRNCD